MAKRAAKVVKADAQAAARAKFLEQGTDPVIAKKALDDATGLSRGLWLSFLTFGTYLVITFAGVTHRDLFLETPITLPVLNAKLPLVTFFWVAPILFVIFHLYLLLSLKLLADQVHNYIGQMEAVGLDTEAQDRARLQLPNFVVVQVLGGTSTQINSWAGRLMTFTAFLTLVAGPLILLLFAQLMFLPYHGWWVTMAQRVMVVIDLVFIWYFWREIRRLPAGRFQLLGISASLATVVTTFFVLMYPGEWFYGPLPKSLFKETGAPLLTFFGDPVIGPDELGFAVVSNTLNLYGEQLVDDQLFERLDQRNLAKGLSSAAGERSLKMLSGRDFRNADFRGIDVRKADLSGSILSGAWLDGAALQGTTFDGAFLQGTSLENASLQGVSLDRSHAQGASFEYSQMQGASLENAELQGTSFAYAQLQSSMFRSAKLHAASLNGANLMGARFDSAYLIASSLSGGELEGANFSDATLLGTQLDSAYVWRTTGFSEDWIADVSGVRLSSNMSRVHVDDIGFSQVEFKRLLEASLVDLPASDVERVKVSLNGLDPNEHDMLDSVEWSKLMNKMAATTDFKSVFLKKFEDSFTDAVCSSDDRPYVANGLARRADLLSFSETHKQETLRFLDKLLSDCPGTKGINKKLLEFLKETRLTIQKGNGN